MDTETHGVSHRLAELCLLLEAGASDEVVRLLRGQGKDVEVGGDGVIVVRTNDLATGLLCGASALDQIAPLSIALFGPMGPALPIYGEAMKIISEHVRILKREKRDGKHKITD